MCYNIIRKGERKPREKDEDKIMTNETTKVITLNIEKELDDYDKILDFVTIYGEEWDENGNVTLIVDREEYDEIFD